MVSHCPRCGRLDSVECVAHDWNGPTEPLLSCASCKASYAIDELPGARAAYTGIAALMLERAIEARGRGSSLADYINRQAKRDNT
jgi:transcription elongation factor Elf1